MANRGLKKGDRVQVRGGNVLLGSYGTVVSDTDKYYGKVDVLFDGYQKPRPIDFSRLHLTEEANPTRSSQMEELIKAIAPTQISSLPIAFPSQRGPQPKTQWQIEQETIQRKRAEALKEVKERKQAAYKIGKEKAAIVLAQLKEDYPTQADLNLEEASIHIHFEIWKRKNKERLQMAYWR